MSFLKGKDQQKSTGNNLFPKACAFSANGDQTPYVLVVIEKNETRKSLFRFDSTHAFVRD